MVVELILAEQTLLIVLDDEKGRDTTHWGSDAGLAAALLLDLARLELVNADADGKIVALDGVPPGHELLRTRTRQSATCPSAAPPRAG